MKTKFENSERLHEVYENVDQIKGAIKLLISQYSRYANNINPRKCLDFRIYEAQLGYRINFGWVCEIADDESTDIMSYGVDIINIMLIEEFEEEINLALDRATEFEVQFKLRA